METVRILIVDDNEFHLIFLNFLLTGLNKNLEIEFALNGEECLVALKKSKFNLIFLDLDMPKMTGQEVIRELSLCKQYELINKIVIHSSSSYHMETLKNYPLKGYLDKPTKREYVMPLLSEIAG